MKRKVEFIESYIKVGNDYQWNDNHGELIRCKDCRNNPSTTVGWIACPMTGAGTRKPNDFCSYAEPKEQKQ